MFSLITTFILFSVAISGQTFAFAPPDHFPSTGISGPQPGCPKVVIKCLLPCKVSIDEDGCKQCLCPKDCRISKCPSGQECRNTCADLTGCQKYQCLTKCTPVTCTNKCPSGYWYDANGCQTCRCKNVCENVVCKVDETCIPKDENNPLAGYDCVPKVKLCCPKLIAPKYCFIQNYCKDCQLDCKEVKCAKDFMCCPDWFGCNRCIKPMIC